MLYTSIPLERIYADPAVLGNEKFISKDSETLKAKENIQYKEITLPHGRIITRQNGEDYIIENVYSTDMKDYLNEDFCPGKAYKQP